MPLAPAAVIALAAACAPGVAPDTLLAVSRVESGLEPLAIGVNGSGGGARRPRTAEEAVRTAEALIAAGRSVDLGLAQINSRNLSRLKLSVAEAFEPCANLRAAARILTAGYARAPGPDQARLRIALSLYNTGHPGRGFANGYVAKVASAAGVRSDPEARPLRLDPPRAAPSPPAWAVFTDHAPPAARPFVISLQIGDRP